MQTFLQSHLLSAKPHYQNHFFDSRDEGALSLLKEPFTFGNSVGQMLAPRTSPAVSSWICLRALWLDPFLYTVYVENLVTVLTVPGCVHRLDLIQADLKSKHDVLVWEKRVSTIYILPYTLPCRWPAVVWGVVGGCPTSLFHSVRTNQP